MAHDGLRRRVRASGDAPPSPSSSLPAPLQFVLFVCVYIYSEARRGDAATPHWGRLTPCARLDASHPRPPASAAATAAAL